MHQFNWLKEFVDIRSTATVGETHDVGLAFESVEDVGWRHRVWIWMSRRIGRIASATWGLREKSARSMARHSASRRFNVKEASKAARRVFSISIEDPELCGRYCGRYIAGVKIGPSPDWLKKRLEAVGVRSINNVADVTNYVMMELGHPMHAFDADKLAGRQIIVRARRLDEKLTTLDGVERQLNPSILVIADAEQPVALAGIMGGGETEITRHNERSAGERVLQSRLDSQRLRERSA